MRALGLPLEPWSDLVDEEAGLHDVVAVRLGDDAYSRARPAFPATNDIREALHYALSETSPWGFPWDSR